jgi:hypothetical protein
MTFKLYYILYCREEEFEDYFEDMFLWQILKPKQL